MKKLLPLLVLALAACGGGGESAPSAPVVVVGTGSPYYPLTPGTYVDYKVTKISAAHVDPVTNEIFIDARDPKPNTLGTDITMQYSLNTCAGLPGQTFYSSEWNFSNDGKPLPTVNFNAVLQDSWYTIGGVRYVGEGSGGTITPGEAKITERPVPGEVIDGTSVVTSGITTGCSTGVVLEPAFKWTYRTLRCVAEWNGYKDVCLTSLVERPNANPVYYLYAFARNIGMVAFSCWRDNPDYYDCGNEYVAVRK